LGIFSRNYERPGPGVSKTEQKKKGIRRFFELILRDCVDLVKLNLLFCLFALPSAALFVSGLYGVGGILVFLLSAVAAFPLGGAAAACFFCITKMLRDDQGYVMHDFWRKFRENAVQAALPGILNAAFVYTQLYLWINMFLGSIPAGLGNLLLLLIAAAFFEMIMPYLFLQIPHLELKTHSIIKNSVFLAIRYIPKSFCGMILGRFVWIASFVLFPLSLWWAPLLLVFGFSLSWLINLMWIWPGVDAVFSIGDTIKARQDQKTDGIQAIFTSRETM